MWKWRFPEAHKTNNEFWSTIGSVSSGVKLPCRIGSFFPWEDKLHLLGNLPGKKVLGIGCGNGRSIKNMPLIMGRGNCGELDISAKVSFDARRDFLEAHKINAKLVCLSATEDKCGLPADYFDLVYSVYGIGWTIDLDKTFRQNIHSYLKRRRIRLRLVTSDT